MLIAKKIAHYFTSKSVQAAQDLVGIKNLPQDVIWAGKVGIRYSRINGDNLAKKVLTTKNAVISRGVKPHLPGIFAGIGFVTPFPLGTVAGFGIGKVLQKII